MDFHWSFPFIIAVLLIAFIVSYASVDLSSQQRSVND